MRKLMVCSVVTLLFGLMVTETEGMLMARAPKLAHRRMGVLEVQKVRPVTKATSTEAALFEPLVTSAARMRKAMSPKLAHRRMGVLDVRKICSHSERIRASAEDTVKAVRSATTLSDLTKVPGISKDLCRKIYAASLKEALGANILVKLGDDELSVDLFRALELVANAYLENVPSVGLYSVVVSNGFFARGIQYGGEQRLFFCGRPLKQMTRKEIVDAMLMADLEKANRTNGMNIWGHYDCLLNERLLGMLAEIAEYGRLFGRDVADTASARAAGHAGLGYTTKVVQALIKVLQNFN